jgi:Mg/Co/Ni transporter MgtE
MSPRAACRLATLGFTHVYDYAAGKVDWLAHMLPAEGTDAGMPTAGSLARQDVATSALDSTAGEALAAIARSPNDFALVVGPGGVLLGRVRRSALQGCAAHDSIEPAMEPGPSTIRPHKTADELRRRLGSSDVKTLVVTRPDGTVIGVVRRDDVPEAEPGTA